MNELLHIHPNTPQPRRIGQVAEALRNGRVVAYPTDSCYGLACAMGDKSAMERIRTIRGLDREHFFTLVCRDLSEISRYAKVENSNFRLLKSATPGPYTFVLPASKQVPNWLAHPRRKTIGIRVPDHAISRAMVEMLGEPFMTVSAAADDGLPLSEATEVRAFFGRRIDLVVDGGATGMEPTTVVDLTGEIPRVLRAGKGSTEAIGLDHVED